jgi:hypothetical protein
LDHKTHIPVVSQFALKPSFSGVSDDSPGLTLLSGLGHVLRTLDHCFDLSVHIHRHEFDIRVLPGKHAKHLIGEGLSHPLNTFEVA